MTDPDPLPAPPSGLALERVEVPAPPPLPEHDPGGLGLLSVLPVLGSLVMVALVTGAPGGAGLLGYAAVGVVVVAATALPLGQAASRRARRRDRVVRQRLAFLGDLDAIRQRLTALGAQSRLVLEQRHPPPTGLAQLLHSGPSPPALEVRARGDPDFLLVRHAVGEAAPPFVLVPAATPDGAAAVDPVAATAAHRMLVADRTMAPVPLVCDLRGGGSWEVTGPEDRARAAIRALVVSTVAAHRPDDVAVTVLAAPEHRREWAWVDWLPHARSSIDDSDHGEGDHGTIVVVVADGVEPPPELRSRPSAVVLHRADAVDGGDRPDRPVRWRLSGESTPFPGVADECDRASAEAAARGVAGRYAAERASRDEDDSPADFEPSWWRRRGLQDELRVRVGRDPSGAPVVLDLKEAADGGVGPHGLLVGATGSGKSELLRTLVLGLAATNPPERLNLVLVDFKGGAAFADLAALPHVSALITNLADDAVLVERARDVLEGELVRRQQLLRTAGVASVGDLPDVRRAPSEDADPPVLPSLLIVVDEFSEVLVDHPDLAEVFVRIGRLGRSLGLHLLLSTQRLEEGRIRGLEAHLSYRIVLRTFTSAESRAALGVPEAHDLPSRPGSGLLRTGPEAPTPFTASYVGRPSQGTAASDAGGCTVLEVAVRAMIGAGAPPARRIWIPPLDRSPSLGELIAGGHRGGPDPPPTHPRHRLAVAVGLVDRPREQRYDDLVVDLDDGHLAVVGAAGSGKSALVTSIVAALALGDPTGEVEVFGLDFGGHLLQTLADLPHVTAMATPRTPELVHRILTELTRRVDSREDLRRRVDGAPASVLGNLVVVVDGWPRLCREQEEVAERLVRLVDRGLGVGLHLVLTAGRWTDLRGPVRDLCTVRLELRLADPLDSELDRRAATLVPRHRPGHGLTPGGGHFVAALPMLGPPGSASRLEEGVSELVARARDRWTGPDRSPLRLLPRQIPLTAVRELARSQRVDGPLIGVEEQQLAPVALDPTAEPHLLVLGESGSGKTSLLRAVIAEIPRGEAGGVAVVLVDPRRSLRSEVPPSILLDHLSTPGRTEQVLRELAGELALRLEEGLPPAMPVGSAATYAGSVYVVVDDYDLVATEYGSPLLPLVPLLPRATEVGLQLVVARRTGGAYRALHDPVLRTLRDLAAPALLLSGRPDDGPLLGDLRPTPMPPGRGRLVTRGRGVQVVQTAWLPPSAPGSAAT